MIWWRYGGSMLTIVRFIYSWCWDLSSVAWCERELSMGKNSVVDWNNAMREVCVHSLQQQQRRKISGEGLIVEIDESMFSKRKKHAG